MAYDSKIKPLLYFALAIMLTRLFACTGGYENSNQRELKNPDSLPVSQNKVESLLELTTSALRQRSYHSEIKLISRLNGALNLSDLENNDQRDNANAFIAEYSSDGLNVYTRIDVPDMPPPASGFPLLIFAHGWVGEQAAPTYNFLADRSSASAVVIDQFIKAGYLVLTPGFRGHGTVNGQTADGIETIKAWDNGSYLSPIFYAIDVLNLLDGVQTLNNPAASHMLLGNQEPVVDLDRIQIMGLSQGGDVALTVLAVAGEGSMVKNNIRAGSIWSGCFARRTTQIETYGPMTMTPQAFMSGDGSWTGSAVAIDGSVNPNFVFGYPSDWIGTTDQSQWTWQSDTWKFDSVEEALRHKLNQMYTAINQNMSVAEKLHYKVSADSDGKLKIEHHESIAQTLSLIGGFAHHQYLREPVNFHHSDRDFYSPPSWNSDLAVRINETGGMANDYTYTGTNHSLKKSKHSWFSPPGTQDGLTEMVKRDLELFR